VILTPSRAVRVFAFPAPADLRNGYNGLFGLVQNKLNADPMCGDLFLFVNESRKLCKVLVWDGTGLCIFQKRLERGCFAKLWRDDGQVVRLAQRELALAIEGCTLIDRRSLSPVAIERKTVVSDPAM
jgi:transposase